MDKAQGEQWQKLCDEHERAMRDYQDAQGVLTWKFAAIARGNSQENPTARDIDRAEVALQRLSDATATMNAFVRRHSLE